MPFHCGLTAEGACVPSVLGDFHFLDLFPEGSTIARVPNQLNCQFAEHTGPEVERRAL